MELHSNLTSMQVTGYRTLWSLYTVSIHHQYCNTKNNFDQVKATTDDINENSLMVFKVFLTLPVNTDFMKAALPVLVTCYVAH
jgi:hypothetical protein